MKFKGLVIFVFLLVAIVIIGLALPNLRNLFFNRASGTASLSLPAGPIAAIVGTEFPVNITLSTGGTPTRGVDVVLNFDNSKLTVTDVADTARTTTTFKTFVPGVTGETTGILDKTAVMATANLTGKVEFGAVTFDYAANQNAPTYGLTAPYNLTTVLATVKFVPKAGATGATSLTFAFSPTVESTTDSNVVDDQPISQTAPYLNDILGSVSPASGTIVNISAGITATPTPTPTPTATPTLALSFMMQGINVSGVAKTVSLTMRNTVSGALTTFSDQSVTSLAGGVFTKTVTMTNLPIGNYDILVKDNSHLRKKLGTMNIVAGANTAPSGMVLKAGDFDGNGVLNALDVGSILNQYTALDIIAPANSIYDIDANGLINLYDVGYVMANYTSVTVNGD